LPTAIFLPPQLIEHEDSTAENNTPLITEHFQYEYCCKENDQVSLSYSFPSLQIRGAGTQKTPEIHPTLELQQQGKINHFICHV